MSAQMGTKTTSYDYDVRAVRLIKSIHGGPLGLTEKVGYISLGHFDFLHVDRLTARDSVDSPEVEEVARSQSKKGDPLTIIQDDRKSGREIDLAGSVGNVNQVYTLYILRQLEKNARPSVERFWSRETTYMVVTRIHCQYPKGGGKKRLTQTLIDHCISVQSGPYRVAFDGRDGEETVMRGPVNGDGNAAMEPVYCLFYDSLELGDCVAVMKGKSIAAILAVVQYLSGERTVRDTYTYCGIRCGLFHSGTARILEQAVHPEAKLTHMTTRFSVRKVRAANQYLSELTDGEKNVSAYITGTTDRILCWHDTSERNLLQIVQEMVRREKPAHSCFNDVITRIGIRPAGGVFPTERSEDEDPAEDGKESLCREEFKDWLNRKHKEPDAPSWVYSLLKLIGTLESMQDNYIMDDLAALITPGAKALLKRMEYLLNLPDKKLDYTFDKDILDFLHNWSDLMHDLSQLESQLTQHPELMPVRYYIPVALLQFELRFMKQCGELLQKDSEHGRQFVPMLVPSGERDLYTIAPLDPGQDSYNGQCPLIVCIPIQDLYFPQNCSLRMAHEIAHYVGDATRMRDQRFAALGECLSHFIGWQWENRFLESGFPGDERCREQAMQELKEQISRCMEKELSEKVPYLDLTTKVMLRTASHIANSTKYQNSYLSTVSPRYFERYAGVYASQKYVQFQLPFQSILLRACENHIEALQHLSSECYADIAMILLLGCDFDRYYDCIYQEEFDRLQKVLGQKAVEPPFDSWVVTHIQRMSLVIMAVEQLWGEKNGEHWVQFEELNADHERVWARWAGGMAQVVIKDKLCTMNLQNDPKADRQVEEMLLDWQTESPKVLMVTELRVMADYLNGCAMKLYEELQQGGKDNSQIREGLDCLGGSGSSNQNSFSWDKLQQYVLGVSAVDE